MAKKTTSTGAIQAEPKGVARIDDGELDLASLMPPPLLETPAIGDYLADSQINITNVAVADEVELPGFAVSDEPFVEAERPAQAPGSGGEKRGIEILDYPPEKGQLPPKSALPGTDSVRIMGNNNPLNSAAKSPIRYEGRVRILEAWQFTGVISEGPLWIDRNWLAYGGYDPDRDIEPGPTIAVPAYSPDNKQHPGVANKICRIGDYVVQQEIKLDANGTSNVVIEVWTASDFERIFIPMPETPLKAPRGSAKTSIQN